MSERDNRQRADVAFHELPVGYDLGSVEYEMSEDLVRRHLQATGQTEYPPAAGDRYAPVSVLASDGIRLAEVRFDIGESVHAGQRLEVMELPIVGTRVTVSGRVTDKFEKRGRQFVVMELTSVDDRGRLLARGVMTGVARYRPGEQA
jgi:hypothetical protein